MLLLDGGDTLFSDQQLTKQTKGAIIVEAMNLIGYDAMVLGEGDLQLGADVLRQRMAEADFAILSANVYSIDEEELFAPAYTIVEVGGLRVGIVGLTGSASRELPDLSVSDPLEAAREWVPQVADQAEVVILLSHQSWNHNLALVDLFPQVDLIVSGGMPAGRAQLYQAESTATLMAQAEYPTSGRAGRFVGRMQLAFDPEGEVLSHEWRIIKLGPEVGDDPEIALLLQRYAN